MNNNVILPVGLADNSLSSHSNPGQSFNQTRSNLLGTDQSLVIASQMDAATNAALTGVVTGHHKHTIQIRAFQPDKFDNLQEAEVLLATPQGWPAQAPQGWPFKLKWIQLVSSGIDFYPEWLFSGVTVTTSRGATALTIVEYVLASLFQQHKKLQQLQIYGPDQWQRQSIPLLHGTTLGIVGYGAIGQLLAQYAQALGLQVIVLRGSQQAITQQGIQQVSSIKELIPQIDHLVLAAPATVATHHLINAQVLAQAKPHLHLINVARGSLIDQHALLEALEQGRIAHATLDVTTPEPLPANHPLYRHSKVTITPHTSATASNVVPAVIQQFDHNLNQYLNQQPLDNRVDFQRGY